MLINMSLEQKIMHDIKQAMLAKDHLKLDVCRSIKSEILILKTQKSSVELNNDKELEVLQKLLKQRKESARIYQEQERLDLAKNELDQADIILTYLPQPYSRDELLELIDKLMIQSGFNSRQDMGKLIGLVIKKSKGRADGKEISDCVKDKLI
tara:strand:- start:424 stop:882 length:459 start_codon:yes stop_codon:yes gene_type:complete